MRSCELRRHSKARGWDVLVRRAPSRRPPLARVTTPPPGPRFASVVGPQYARPVARGVHRDRPHERNGADELPRSLVGLPVILARCRLGGKRAPVPRRVRRARLTRRSPAPPAVARSGPRAMTNTALQNRGGPPIRRSWISTDFRFAPVAVGCRQSEWWPRPAASALACSP